MDNPTQAARDAAEKWLKERFPIYRTDRSVMSVDVEVFLAGYARGQADWLAALRSGESIEFDWTNRPYGLSPTQWAAWLERKFKVEK